MRTTELLSTAVSLEIALDRIKHNNSHQFMWVAVKNKKGAWFEIGGTNRNNNLEFKAYIPVYENKKVVSYNNGFVNSYFGITNKGSIEFPRFNDSHSFSENELIEWLDTTNFKTYKPRFEDKEEIEIKTIRKVKL